MKRLSMIMVCLFAMMAASMSAKAQEVTITLWPGWNWISYPNAEVMDVASALGEFVPMNGDKIKSQFTNSAYYNGYWRGGVTHFMPGYGYMYYSNRTEVVSFVFNKPPMPTGTLIVTTGELSNITSTTADCGGSAVSNDGTSILMKGVCWATHPQPTTNDSYTEDGSGPGAFTAEMTELAAETEYYVRAYAVSVKGINYGEELSFTTAPQGILNGLFSVGENTQVCFSQGNLQYQASTNTWRFAENQWDFVGESNINASSTYDGWIDLYCYGTSGYNHGSVCYQPWSTSKNNGDYQVYGNGTYNLPDQSGQADWGFNPISNGGNMEALWRTMTIGEWDYMLNARSTLSGIRYVKANVNGFNGWILLPDNWNASWLSLNNANDMGVSFESNIITETEWNTALESNGAVFLPFAGYRYGQSEYNPDRSDYWSSTSDANGETACCFSTSAGGLTSGHWRGEAKAVRLVRPAQANTSYSIEAVPSLADGGTISGTGTYDYYAQVTLTATANEGYTFYQWKENGNVVSTESTISFVALSDRNLEACFLENHTYPLLYSFNDDNHTAIVTGHWDGQNATGDLVIPETVMHNGEVYTVTTIGDWAFAGSHGIVSVVISNTISRINEFAFYSCDGVATLYVSESVTSFDGSAFMGMNNLEQLTVAAGNSVYDSRNNCNAIIETSTNTLVRGFVCSTIPNTVTAIAAAAFARCGTINSITIPSSVNSIGGWAFGDVPIGEMYVFAETPPFTEGAFHNHDMPVYIPCGCLEAYQNANGWNEFTNFVEMCHAYVDLGLPSGLLWATCNVGADNPEDYGDYFAWGETQPKSIYNWSTYQYCNGDYNTLTKYCSNSSYGYNGFTDDLTTLLPEDDAATANWGSDWRMPTKEEWQELFNNTTVTWTTQNGVNGRLFTASNGNSLFLPAAGFRLGGNLGGAGSWGNYWSSSLHTDYPDNAWYFYFNSGYCYMSRNLRIYGQSVRPVRSVQNTAPTGAINGKFTINANGDQVYFSQGNLQYIGSAAMPYWKFADNQWDVLGTTTGQNSSSQNVDRDLFGWGTSGWNNGNVFYQPYDTQHNGNSNQGYGYGPTDGISYTYNLTGTYANADWGVYNPISNGGNQANQWRTLTHPEWNYVFNTRTTSSGIRYAKANVNNVNGVILLPDDWSSDTYSLSNTNSTGASFSSNTISASQWNTLEQAGAVFLPAAGYRPRTSVYNVGSYGYYWSTSYYNSEGRARGVYFYDSYLSTDSSLYRDGGYSVRLACVAE